MATSAKCKYSENEQYQVNKTFINKLSNKQKHKIKYQTNELAKNSTHYENTRIQIYRKLHLQKKIENFQIKTLIFSIFLLKNIDCGYSLEPPRRGGSNEYHNLCFWAEIRKIMYTPVNPSFTL